MAQEAIKIIRKVTATYTRKRKASESFLIPQGKIRPNIIDKEEELASQKSMHELKAAGENARFNDEVFFILQGLESEDERIYCAEDLFEKCKDSNFLGRLKATGTSGKIIRKLYQSTDPALDLFLLYFLSIPGNDVSAFDHKEYPSFLFDILLSDQRENLKIGPFVQKLEKSLMKRYQHYSWQDIALQLLLNYSSEKNSISDERIGQVYRELMNDILNYTAEDLTNRIKIVSYLIDQDASSNVCFTEFFSIFEHIFDDEMCLNGESLKVCLRILVNSSASQPIEVSRSKFDKLFNLVLQKPDDDTLCLVIGLLINLIENSNENMHRFRKLRTTLVVELKELFMKNLSALTAESRILCSYYAILIGLIIENLSEVGNEFKEMSVQLLKEFIHMNVMVGNSGNSFINSIKSVIKKYESLQ